MRRSYIICPYCGKETALQGIDMHIKSRHPEKYAEYKKNYDTLKKTAIRREVNTKLAKSQPPVSEPAASTPAVAAAPPKRTSRIPIKRSTVLAEPVAPADPGGEAPPSDQGAYEKSFLEEVTNGILDWINSP